MNHIKPTILKVLVWIIVTFPGFVYAQDFHLSQYESSPMIMNPAMTGLFKGSYRVSLHQRNQWGSVLEKPFLTSAFSYDTHVKKIRLGGYVMNNRAGSGGYNALTGVVSAAYDYALRSHPSHHFSLGVQAGIIHKSFSVTNLSFEDQYRPQNGGSFSGTTGETFADMSVVLPEVNLGFMYYQANTTKTLNPFVGLSTFHITQPKETFYGTENKLPSRWLGHAGVKINVNERVQFLVNVLGLQQKNAQEMVLSLLGYYYLKSHDTYLLLGAAQRTNKDAFIIHGGLKFGKIQFRMSYDINTSGLQSISNGQGGFEISVVYIGKKINPNPIHSCIDL